MAYYILIKDNQIVGKTDIKILNTDIQNIKVSQDVFNEIEKYIYQNGEIILNPNYEQEQKQALITQFNAEFFNTSLGYVKRKVTMKDGSIKDFLSDILPLLTVNVPIITYNYPDVETGSMPTQNVGVMTTEHFINECKNQVLIDIYGS